MRFDGPWAESTLGAENNYRYNGKELVDDLGLNWYAYGARYYDPAIGRFTGVDPIADQFAHLSVYNYASNDPIKNVDLHGLQGVHHSMVDGEGNVNHVIEKNVVVLTRAFKEVPKNASEGQTQRIQRQNARIARNNTSKVESVREELNEFFNGSDGAGTPNSRGENTFFKFNVSGLQVEDTADKTTAQQVSKKNALETADTTPSGYKLDAPAAVITTMSSGGSHGKTSGNIVHGNNANAPKGTISHEVGHTLNLNDSYGGISGSGSGLMGSPPTRILSSEVDKVIARSRKAKGL